jgi:hypothetical protein
MWESLSFILKAAAMALIFTLLALGAGVGIVRAANRRAPSARGGRPGRNPGPLRPARAATLRQEQHTP